MQRVAMYINFKYEVCSLSRGGSENVISRLIDQKQIWAIPVQKRWRFFAFKKRTVNIWEKIMWEIWFKVCKFQKTIKLTRSNNYMVLGHLTYLFGTRSSEHKDRRDKWQQVTSYDIEKKAKTGMNNSLNVHQSCLIKLASIVSPLIHWIFRKNCISKCLQRTDCLQWREKHQKVPPKLWSWHMLKVLNDKNWSWVS